MFYILIIHVRNANRKRRCQVEQNAREIFQVFSRRFGFLNKACCNAGGHDISLVQSHILYEIQHQYQPSMQQVADTLGTDITTFSRQVRSLMKINLIKKTPDPNDRRISILSLTEEGKQVALDIDQQMNQYLEDVFASMSPEEKEMVLHSLQLLNKSMQQTSRCCTTPIG